MGPETPGAAGALRGLTSRYIRAVLDVQDTMLPGVRIVVPTVHSDARGEFLETYNAAELAREGITDTFVQDNSSLSVRAGTVRGLHFQAPPGVAKLIRVVRGAVVDVAVDVHAGSPMFGRHVAVVLTASNRVQLYVPTGFAHGFCTLVPDTEVAYKVSGHWSVDVDRGLRWDDPALGIDWPVRSDDAVVSEKDRGWPTLEELTPFVREAP